MSNVIDNLIAYRVLSMLVTPFSDTQAFKLGIIDDKGQNLIRSRDFTNSDQKQAYTYLHRLVFNLKKILNKLPGGESKLKNIIAAFFLIKESYNDKSAKINEQDVIKVINMLDKGAIFVEEQLIVENFLWKWQSNLVNEEAPANATGPMVSTDIPVIKKKKLNKTTVDSQMFKRNPKNKMTYSEWRQHSQK